MTLIYVIEREIKLVTRGKGPIVKQLRKLLGICFLVGVVILSSGCGDGADAAKQELAVGHNIGNMAPNFVLKDINGEVVDLKSYRGKVVLIDFWDTWCPPCIKALPHLQELHMETKDQGIVVLAIAGGRKGESGVRSFIEKNKYTFTAAVGDRGVFSSYNVSSIPATYIVGPDGIIRDKWVGGKSKKQYEAAVHAAAGNNK